jgi:hypothetical protein
MQRIEMIGARLGGIGISTSAHLLGRIARHFKKLPLPVLIVV